MPTDVPSDDAIKALPLGALTNLRYRLLQATGGSGNYLTTYEAILSDTLSIALLIRTKENHAAALPPEPPWVKAVEQPFPVAEAVVATYEPQPSDHHRLDDPDVVARMNELIDLDMSDEEIWSILKTEFVFNENHL